jgi:glycopeptide antibiotics resistance protein
MSVSSKHSEDPLFPSKLFGKGLFSLFAIIWAGLILYFSIKIAPGAGVIGDKSIHIFAFFVFAVLIYFATRENSGAIVYAMLFAFAYSIIMEIVQLYIPGRFASLGDIAANAIGVVLAIAVYEKTESLTETLIK